MVGPFTICLQLADGSRLAVTRVDAERAELDHAYAMTIHKGQGATVDRAFLLGSDALYREAGYVGLSRARQRSDFYIVGSNALRAELAHGPEGGPRQPLGEVPGTMTAAIAPHRAGSSVAAEQRLGNRPVDLLLVPRLTGSPRRQVPPRDEGGDEHDQRGERVGEAHRGDEGVIGDLGDPHLLRVWKCSGGVEGGPDGVANGAGDAGRERPEGAHDAVIAEEEDAADERHTERTAGLAGRVVDGRPDACLGRR
jgi:hypothetical protein